jgi:lipopolysaccharide export system permease protein
MMRRVSIKRVDWLIGTTVLGAVLMVLLVLTGLDAVIQFVRQLGSVGRNGYTITHAMVYVLVTLPRRSYEMFGNAALIGGLLGLGGLAGSGELTALRACGLSKLRIANAAVGVIAMLTVAVVVIGETAAPWGDQRAQAMLLKLKASNLGMAGNTGLWARDGARIINAKAALARQTATHASVQLADVRVFTLTSDGQLARFDWARTAEHDGRAWVLSDVRSATLDAQGVHSVSQPSERWDSSLDPRILEQSVIHPEYLPMRDLRRNMAYLEANGESPGVYALAYWGRALYPLNVLVLVLCAMPFAFGALRSGGLGKRIFLGILLAIGWYFLQKAMVSFGSVYGIPPMLANLLPALLLMLAAWLYFRRFA